MPTWGILLLVFAGLVILFSLPGVIKDVFKSVKSKRRAVIQEKSPLIFEIRRLNRSTVFHSYDSNEIRYVYRFDNRRTAVNFDIDSGFRQYAKANGEFLEQVIEQYEMDFVKYQVYCQQIKQIKNSYHPSLELIKSLHISSKSFEEYEKEIADEYINHHSPIQPSLVIGVYYTSPQGRSVYEDEVSYSETDIAVFLGLSLDEIRSRAKTSESPAFVIDYHYLSCGIRNDDKAFENKPKVSNAEKSTIGTEFFPEKKRNDHGSISEDAPCSLEPAVPKPGPSPIIATEVVKPEVVYSSPSPNAISESTSSKKDAFQGPDLNQNGECEQSSGEGASDTNHYSEEEESNKEGNFGKDNINFSTVSSDSAGSGSVVDRFQTSPNQSEDTRQKKRVVITKSPSGIFASKNGEEVQFYPYDGSKPLDLSELSFYEKQSLDEALLKTCLKAFAESGQIPLPFDNLLAFIRNTYGEDAISETYLLDLVQPHGPFVLRVHIFYIWPNPATCPSEGVDAKFDFSFDVEDKICRFYQLVKSRKSPDYPIISIFLRFFLSFSRHVYVEDNSTVYSVPFLSLANYYLLFVREEINDSAFGFRAIFNLGDLTSIDPKRIADFKLVNFFAEPYFKSALDSVCEAISKKIDLSNRFFVLGGEQAVLVDGAFLRELSAESRVLTKELAEEVSEYERENGFAEKSRFFDLNLFTNLSRPDYPFDFSDAEVGIIQQQFGSLFEKPFLSLTFAFSALVSGGIMDEESVYSLLIKSGYKIVKSDGFAFKKRYLNLADAIYRGDILANQKTEYVYDNPDKLKAYDFAIKSLINDLSIFYDRPGVYKTRVYLEQLGLTSNDLDTFQKMLKKFISKNEIFSYGQIRNQCAGTAIESLIQDDQYLSLFVNSVCHPSRYSLEKESGEYIYYTVSFESMLKKLFRKVLEGNLACTIYEIRDDIQADFGLTYNLDQIGKDAVKAGFYYSDDYEKVYKKKTDYLMEVYSHK